MHYPYCSHETSQQQCIFNGGGATVISSHDENGKFYINIQMPTLPYHVKINPNIHTQKTSSKVVVTEEYVKILLNANIFQNYNLNIKTVNIKKNIVFVISRSFPNC